jgi:hypothetical protein
VPRYYFDSWVGDLLTADDEGVELAGIGTVHNQAAVALAELAKDVLPGTVREGSRLRHGTKRARQFLWQL